MTSADRQSATCPRTGVSALRWFILCSHQVKTFQQGPPLWQEAGARWSCILWEGASMSANTGAALCLWCCCPPSHPRHGSDNFPTSELATVLRHHTSRLLVHQQKETEAFLRLLFRFFLSLSLSPRDKRENLKIKSKMVADNIVVLADSS